MTSLPTQKIFLGFLSLLAGIISPLAFAPFNYYFIAEIALVFLLIAWNNASPKLSFWYGWLYGLGFFGCGVYWVYISIYHYGNAPLILALLILVLLVSFLSLYPAMQGYILNRFYPQNSNFKFLLTFPASLVIMEFLRGWILTGFPWLFLGYSHIDTPLRGWATIFGVYGVSFAIAQTAGALFRIYSQKNRKNFVALSALIILLWGIGFCLTTINWTKQNGSLIKVSLIQGNIPQEQKWQAEKLQTTLTNYAQLTADNFASKIIVWPEAAIPTYPENVHPYLEALAITAKKHNTTILIGIPFTDYAPNGDRSDYNGILALGETPGKYYKRKLVPFGEYFPCKIILNWLRKFIIIPMSDFSSGTKTQPKLFAGNVLLAPFICYEIAYPDLVLQYLPQANLLVTVSDDSWFGDSAAAAQHLEIAQMRSLEVARYQLLCTNTGFTAIINAQGKIVATAPTFKQLVVNGDIVALTSSTFWVKYGQYLYLPLLLLGMWRRKK